MAGSDLTAERLRELFHYDPETGVFRRLIRINSRANSGQIAGCVMTGGYLRIGIDYKHYAAHRLAWLHYYGKWPDHFIDHIDGNPGNNAIANLRDASPRVNSENVRQAQKRTISGFLGVTDRGRPHPRYVARIGSLGKSYYLGTFDTKEEAHKAYVEAKRRLHLGCTI